MATGVAVGAGSSLWVERRVRRTIQEAQARMQPDALVAEVGRTARQAAEVAGERVRGAVTAGRAEMKEHERRLWDDLAERGVDPPDAYLEELAALAAAEEARRTARPRRFRWSSTPVPTPPPPPTARPAGRTPAPDTVRPGGTAPAPRRRRRRSGGVPDGPVAAKSPSHLDN
jgi:hypothetical protein